MEFKKINGKGKDNKTTYHLSMKIWSSTKTIDFNIDNGKWPNIFIYDAKKDKDVTV